jgi:hypothetical protein
MVGRVNRRTFARMADVFTLRWLRLVGMTFILIAPYFAIGVVYIDIIPRLNSQDEARADLAKEVVEQNRVLAQAVADQSKRENSDNCNLSKWIAHVLQEQAQGYLTFDQSAPNPSAFDNNRVFVEKRAKKDLNAAVGYSCSK